MFLLQWATLDAARRMKFNRVDGCFRPRDDMKLSVRRFRWLAVGIDAGAYDYLTERSLPQLKLDMIS